MTLHPPFIPKTTMPRLITAACLALALTAGIILAKGPVQNVTARAHPNLAAAQKLAAQAYDKITAAQRANEFDLGGHAQRAKDLLDQVNQELKLAIETSDENAAAR